MERRGPYRDIVILNSAAALYVDDKVKNIKDGMDYQDTQSTKVLLSRL